MIDLTLGAFATIRAICSGIRSRSLGKWAGLAALFVLHAIVGGHLQLASAQTKSSTTTTLTVSSGTSSSPATTVTSGSVITLTATVTAGSTPVTVGQVSFCDALAKACTDIHRFGLAQLTSAGTAVLKFRPGPASHQYKAVFAGTTKYAGSASANVALDVTGGFRTTTLLSSSGSTDNYSLTAMVYGNGGAAPTGDVSFLNTSNANAVLGSAKLGNAVAGVNLLGVYTPFDLGTFGSIAVGDFNGDGIPDVAVAAYTSGGVLYPYGNNVFILLGQGDGSFNPSLVSTTSSGPSGPSGGYVVAGDFNGDGKLDLAVANGSSSTLSILLGNGDGTFTASASSPATGAGASSIVVADFNGDGIADLAVANSDITILLGNGDGTFTPTSAGVQTGSAPFFFTSADFNGDGTPDLAVLSAGLDSNNNSVNTLTVYLGHGDGTFTLVTKGPGTGTRADAVAIADFNGDGTADLAIAVQSSGTLSVLTGNGDGTFNAGSQTSLPAGFSPFLQTGDFNGDGKTDLVVLYDVVDPCCLYPSDELAVLLGDGAGGFSPPSSTVTGGEPASTGPVTGDWNGDGVDDIVSPANGRGGGGVSVLLLENQSANATVNGINVGPGAFPVMASYPGDKNYQPSASYVVTLAGPTGSAVASVTVTPSATTITDQQSLSLNVTVAGAQGMPAPTGSVYLFDGLFNPGMALSNGAATLTLPGGALTPGGNGLTVFYSGDAVYAEASGTATVTVSSVLMAATAPTAIAAGGTATATVTLTASSYYSGTLNLSCTLTMSPANAQSPPTCGLNPSTATVAAGGNATTALTVKTTAATAAMLMPQKTRLWGRGTEAAAFAALLMIGLRARRRRWLSILALLVTAICVMSGGCGGSHSTPPPPTPGTTAGTYVFTVKAVDSKDTTIATSANVSVTVQ